MSNRVENVGNGGGGGGGVTFLLPAELPNGNITTFTFSSATGQPRYAINDGVWLPAMGTSGNTNWTWNGGTKQVTFTTAPPTSDARAVQ